MTKECELLNTTEQTHRQDLERLQSLRYRGDDEIGKLMHDFPDTNPDDKNYDVLAKKARYFKQDEKGMATMCKIMEDMRNEVTKKAVFDSAGETTKRMIKDGEMSLKKCTLCANIVNGVIERN